MFTRSRARLSAALVLLSLLAAAVAWVVSPTDQRREARPLATVAKVTKSWTAPMNSAAPRQVKPSARWQRRMDRLQKQAERAAARRERWLQSPRAVRERRRSRTKFRDLAAGAALRAGQSTQPAVAVRPAWRPPTLKRSERVLSYQSATRALVRDDATRRQFFVEAAGSARLAAAPQGKPGAPLKALDLRLLTRGDSFVPQNASVPVALPRSSDRAAAIGTDLSLSLGGRAPGVVTAGGQKVFYANQAVDTDAILEPTASGAEVSWLLRSPRSPEALTFDLGGVSLDEVSIDAATGGLTLGSRGRVSAPVAVDAQGSPVAVRFVKNDDGIAVEVKHRRGDVAYPIAVDPVIDAFGTTTIEEMKSDGSAQFDGFSFSINPAGSTLLGYGTGGTTWRSLYVLQGGGTASAWWAFDPVRTSSAFRAEFVSVSHLSPSATCLTAGLYSRAVGWPETHYGAYVNPGGTFGGSAPSAFSNCVGTNGIYVVTCADGNCAPGGTSVDNIVAFQLQATNRATGRPTTEAKFAGAYIFHRETTPPAASVSGLPTGWNNGTMSATVTAQDDGVGFCSPTSAQTPNDPSLEISDAVGIVVGTGRTATCTSSNTYNGPTSQTYSWSAPTSGWTAEGSIPLTFKVRDAVNNSVNVQKTVLVDRSAPRAVLGGRMAGYLTERGAPNAALPYDIRTVTGLADLTIGIQETKPGILTSGIASGSTVQARVMPLDPTTGAAQTTPALTLFTTAPSCAGTNDCDRAPIRIAPGTASAPAGFSSLAPGLYQLEVQATDRTGNVLNKAYVFARGGGEISSVADGQSTARWVPLEAARTAGAPTQATFQWRTGTAAWTSIPGDSLFSESTSAKIGSATVAMNNGKTGRYVLDINEMLRLSTPFLLGPPPTIVGDRLQIRATFNGSGGVYDKISESVSIRLDRGGRDTSDANAPLGPGSVDLLTGNYSVDRTDAVLPGHQSDVALSRVYGSRYSTEKGLLGPGWSASVAAEANGGFVRVVDLDDPARDLFDKNPTLWGNSAYLQEWRMPAVSVESADGSSFIFEQREGDNAYVPELGFENYKLVRESTSSGATTTAFVLTDNDTGEKTTFSIRLDDPQKVATAGSVEHGTFGAATINAPGDPGSPDWTYAPSNSATAYPGISSLSTADQAAVAKKALRVPVRISSSTDGTLNCADPAPGGTLARGCRTLTLKYTALASPSFEPRLASVSITAYDPASAAMTTMQVASYSYDTAGRLISVTDERSGLAEQYTYDWAGLLSSVKPAGRTAVSLAYSSLSDDVTSGRLSTTSWLDGGVTALQKVVYSDRTFGGANPWDLSTTSIDRWDQKVTPFRAAAVFDPMATPGTDAASLRKATITYLDALGRPVNNVDPGGATSTTEYDKWGNVTRTLSAEGRAQALAATNTVDVARRRSSYTTYEPDGRGAQRPVYSVSPERQSVRVGSSSVTGRSFTRTAYDEGFDTADPKMPYNLPTSARNGLVVGADAFGNGGTEQEVRRQTMAYEGRESDGTTILRQPTRIVERDSAGNALRVNQVVLDSQGRELERRQPRQPGTHSTAADAPSTTKTIYWKSGTTADGCGSRPEWAGLVCKVGPAAAPTTAGLPGLPTKTFEYDVWRRPAKVTETVSPATGPAETRVTATTFDAKDRPLVESTTASSGSPVDDMRHVYDATTGAEIRTEQLGSSGTVLRSITRAYDGLGRLTTYTDSSGAQTNRTYDLSGRLVGASEWNGSTQIASKTYTYDAATGRLSGLKDSGLDATNPMTVTYDADGNPTSVTYPSGLSKLLSYDETGAPTGVQYRPSGCSSAACAAYSNTVQRGARGEVLSEQSAPGDTRSYSYDDLSRLVRVTDAPAAGACTTRTYSYDADSNRLSRRSDTAGSASDPCPSGTGGSAVTSSYDDADRLVSVNGHGLGDASPTYDAWGRITLLPKQANGGSKDLLSTYFANDLARTVSDGSTTVTNTLDPLERIRTRTVEQGTSGGTIETSAYGDDSDEPIFIRTAAQATPGTETGWSRYVEDPTGDLAAVVDSSGSQVLQVSSVNGDVVGELAAISGASNLSNRAEVDEFGVPAPSAQSKRYGFLGAKQREALVEGLAISMGARTYSPWTGRFLQTDPVLGGSANTYDYGDQDPLNNSDLSGNATCQRIAANATISGWAGSLGTFGLSAILCSNGKTRSPDKTGGLNLLGNGAGVVSSVSGPVTEYLGGRRGITQISMTVHLERCWVSKVGAVLDLCDQWADFRVSIRLSRRGGYRASYVLLAGDEPPKIKVKCTRQGKRAGCKSRIK